MDREMTVLAEAEEPNIDDVNLLDFPNEVLLRIFKQLNDTNLLDMSHVCIRFKTIAKETFAKKYNGTTKFKYFKVRDTDSEGTYRPFFEQFGDKMTALQLIFDLVDQSTIKNWIYKLIKAYCSNVTHIIITTMCSVFDVTKIFDLMPSMVSLSFTESLFAFDDWSMRHYPQLISFKARQTAFLNDTVLCRFINNNPQLQHFHLECCARLRNPLQILNGKLKQLRSLVWKPDNMNTNEFDDIVFEELKSLTITVSETTAQNVLAAFGRGCKQIERLEVFKQVPHRIRRNSDEEMESIDPNRFRIQHAQVIGTFKQLTSLRLSGFNFNIDCIRILIEHLPALMALSIERERVFLFMDSISHEDILLMFNSWKHLKSISISDHPSEAGPYYSKWDFCRKIHEIAQCRSNTIRFRYNDSHSKVVVTGEQCTFNGAICYWSGYDPDLSQSKVHFTDLNEHCLAKIIEYLPNFDVCQLYQTCKYLKKIAAKQLQNDVWRFGTYDIPKMEDWFDIVESEVRHLELSIDPYEESMREIIDVAHRRCGNNVTELLLTFINTDVLNEMNLSFPNLEKLTIWSIESSSQNLLPSMHCPKLKSINIGTCEMLSQENIFNPVWGISLNNLTVIKFELFDEIAEALLNLIDSKICNQIQVFTVEKVQATLHNSLRINTQLVNLITRFRNLNELHIIGAGIELANTTFMFQNCTKITKLSLRHNPRIDREKFRQLLLNVKENCTELNVIQLVRHNSVRFEQKLFECVTKIFPNIKLYNVTHDCTEHDQGYKTYRIATFESSSILKICPKPY